MNGVCAAIAVEETKKSVADSIGRLQYTRIIPIVILVLHPEIDSSESRSARRTDSHFSWKAKIPVHKKYGILQRKVSKQYFSEILRPSVPNLICFFIS